MPIMCDTSLRKKSTDEVTLKVVSVRSESSPVKPLAIRKWIGFCFSRLPILANYSVGATLANSWNVCKAQRYAWNSPSGSKKSKYRLGLNELRMLPNVCLKEELCCFTQS